jgi:hypothetical protein
MSTLKTLLNSVSDENEVVRRTIEKEVIQRYTVEGIVEYYSKSHIKASFQAILNSILENKNLKISNNFINFIREISIAMSLKESVNERLLNSSDNENKSITTTNKMPKSEILSDEFEKSV